MVVFLENTKTLQSCIVDARYAGDAKGLYISSYDIDPILPTYSGITRSVKLSAAKILP